MDDVTCLEFDVSLKRDVDPEALNSRDEAPFLGHDLSETLGKLLDLRPQNHDSGRLDLHVQEVGIRQLGTDVSASAKAEGEGDQRW